MIFGNLEKKENNNNKCRRIRAESFNGLKHVSFLGKFFFCMQNKHVYFSYMYIRNLRTVFDQKIWLTPFQKSMKKGLENTFKPYRNVVDV